MLEDSIVAILRCPVTKQNLRWATDAEKTAKGLPVAEEALVTVDGSRTYRSQSGILILLPDSQLEETVATGL